MPLSVAVDYLKYAVEQEQEEVIRQQWQRLYPWMAAGLLGWKPYNEFRRELIKPRVRYSEKSSEEIEGEMLAVVAAYEGKKGR